MRIGIIGFGTVGQAVSWAHRSHEIIVNDPKLIDSVPLSEFVNCDAIYVCVPSPPVDPSLEDGHCNSSIIESTLKTLAQSLTNKWPAVICKTTLPPSTYERLQKEYPKIVHCPEFLTSSNSIADYQNSEYFVLGGDPELCAQARIVIQQGVPLVGDKFLITDIKTAALYKYMMNSYLATKVTFMNEFKQLADAEGVKWKNLKELSVFDDRIGYTHMNVPGNDQQYGWGGSCFPKDIAAIIEEAHELGTDLELLGRVEDINKKHRKR